MDLEVIAANFGHAAIKSPQFIDYAHTPAGVTLHWLRPIACQPTTVGHYGQAAALVANERSAVTTTNARTSII